MGNATQCPDVPEHRNTKHTPLAFCTVLFVPWAGRARDDTGEFYYYISCDNTEPLHMMLWVVAFSSSRTWRKIHHVAIRSCTNGWKTTKVAHFSKGICFAHFLLILVFISNLHKLVEPQTFAHMCSYWIILFQTAFRSWSIGARAFQLLLFTFLSLPGCQRLISDHSNLWLSKTFSSLFDERQLSFRMYRENQKVC